MLTNARMKRLRIILLKRHAQGAAEAVGRLGVLELAETALRQTAESPAHEMQEQIERCRRLRKRLEGLMGILEIEAPEPSAPAHGAALPSLAQVEQVVGRAEESTAPVRNQFEGLIEQRRLAQEAIEQLAPYRELRVPPSLLADASFLHIAAGDMPQWQIAAARQALPGGAVLVPIGAPEGGAGEGREQAGRLKLRRVLALSSRRSRFALQTILEEHQFEPGDLPAEMDSAPAAIYDGAQARRDSLTQQIEEIRKPLRLLGRALGSELRQAGQQLRLLQKLAEAEQSFGATWATAIINGWCPENRVEDVRRAVGQVTAGQAVFESDDATAEDIAVGRVPSCAQVPRWLRPFGRLARGMGEPHYLEVEPTLLFAASFLLLFGIVFGDLGHGLCLLAIGLLARRWSKKADIRDLGYVIACAGVSSALFGAFFDGAFFGKSLEQMGWRLTLGLEPLRMTPEGPAPDVSAGVLRYMAIALFAGVSLISLGLVLNLVNRLRMRDYEGLLLGRFGLAGVMFYWGAIALGIKLAATGPSSADPWLALGALGVPLLVVALHHPIYALATGQRPVWEERPFMGIFEGLVEAFDTALTYLANTFSFLRVAAFALSHAALCFTIFVIQGLVEGPVALLWSPLVFLLGTALVIGLEGLIVFIQIFRLEYYEFFTKFFSGGGHRFRPFRLDENQAEE